MKFLPLSVEFILLEFIESDLSGQCFPGFCKSRSLSVLQRLRPLAPADAAVIILDRHEQAVVIKPVCLFCDKCPVILTVLAAVSAETVVGFFQHFESGSVDFLVIDIFRLSKVVTSALASCEKPFTDQRLQIDEVRIPRIRGERLVRGIPVPGRSKRQDLPVSLAGFLQLVCEFISFL